MTVEKQSETVQTSSNNLSMNSKTLSEQFSQNGYVVIEELISPEHCKDLLQFIVGSFGQEHADFILEAKSRMHTPLVMNELTQESIRQITQPMHTALDQFLKGEQNLVELSSITAFPYAAAQNLHPDESNIGKYIVSVFVNLAPTREDTGALRIVPGSHKDPDKTYDIEESIPVELPIGSAVFMNSKTWHCGGANESLDCIRPVFYFSFGDSNVEGPTYSIREDVAALNYTLSDFNPALRHSNDFQLSDIPIITPHMNILASLMGENKVYLLRDNEYLGWIDIGDIRVFEIIRMISMENATYSVDDIGKALNFDQESLIHIFNDLVKTGLITWRASPSQSTTTP